MDFLNISRQINGSSAQTRSVHCALPDTPDRVFEQVVTFAYPKGLSEFALADAEGIKRNLRFLAQGLVYIAGGTKVPTVRSIPGVALLLGL